MKKSACLTIVGILGTALILIIAGCGGGGGGSSAVTSGVSVAFLTPDNFSFTGGDVQIIARLSNLSSAKSVKAVVIKPNGSSDPNTLTMASSSEQNTYMATYTVQPNLSSNNTPDRYTVSVTVLDGTGKTIGTASGTLQVPAPDMPARRI